MDILVNIDVPDLERATAFYRNAFGLTMGRRLGPSVVELLGAAVPIYLLEKPPGGAATPSGGQRDYARHWTPVHLDIVVEDVARGVERAVDAGARLEKGPEAAGWGTIALLADPFGNGFCIMAFSEEGYDTLAVPETAGDGPAG